MNDTIGTIGIIISLIIEVYVYSRLMPVALRLADKTQKPIYKKIAIAVLLAVPILLLALFEIYLFVYLKR
jgi:hypothetical protein